MKHSREKKTSSRPGQASRNPIQAAKGQTRDGASSRIQSDGRSTKSVLSPLNIVLIAVMVGGLGVLSWQLFSGNGASASMVDVKVPRLSVQAAAGRTAFDANCASCHGKSGGGSNLGPPLVHDIYNPGHHADESFYRAVHQGVQRHHWQFGNMPPAPQVVDSQIADIIRYMRELQEANGIFYRSHQM